MTKLVSTSRRPVSGGMGARKHFFDVRVFNPFAASYRTLSVPALYRRHEREKRARYEERVREVERAAFTPLVFSAAGGASKLTTTFLKRLASLLAERLNEPYCVAMAWLRARLSFSLLRSAIACLRSSRRKFNIDSEELHPRRPCRRASRVAHLNNHIIPMLLVFFLLFLSSIQPRRGLFLLSCQHLTAVCMHIFSFTYTFSWHMHAHIHRHTCLSHVRTHTRSNATVVTGFCSSFPLAEFPFPLFSVICSPVFGVHHQSTKKKKKRNLYSAIFVRVA